MGRKSRSRKTNSSNTKRSKYKTAGHTKQNKLKKQERHEKKQSREANNKIIVEDLIVKACEKLKVDKYGLKKKIGTLNRKRLQDIVDNIFYSQDWYINRQEKIANKNKKHKFK